MEWERSVTVDQREQRLLAGEQEIARIRAEQLQLLEDLDRLQVATGDGCRSLSEWVAGRLDLSPESAKSLVRTMRRTIDRPDMREALTGGASFDRIEALSRIDRPVGLLEHLDVAGVRHEAAKQTRISRDEEMRAAEDQFLVLQPSLDESWWRLWGGLDGYSGALVDKALTEAADQLPPLPDGTRRDTAWRRALALTELCVTGDAPPAQISVFVDAGQALATDGEAGVELEAGPRIGRDALEAILCEAVTELTVTEREGRLMAYGRRTRSIPPALRRAILHRDGNSCAADGCPSCNRLQVHHLQPWSRGGPTDPANLITLCWFHHQVVVHRHGFQAYRHPDHGRIRFRDLEPRGSPVSGNP
jgi:5-methylcytosine-specific restriction endonuclease McrA